MISLLRTRGLAITNLDWKKLEETDKQITELFKDENKTKLLRQPCVAFITFQSDDSVNEALIYQKKSLFKRNKNLDSDRPVHTICNKIPEFKQAPEPTNIIWENRHIKGWNYYARTQAIGLVSIFMLTLAFYAIFYFKKYQTVVVSKWP